MSLFHHVIKFKLVYSDKEFYQQKCSQFSPFEYPPTAKENLGFRKSIFWRGKRRKELDLNYLIKQGKLKGDWIAFKAWYNHNKGHILFRALRNYSIPSLKNIIRYGNDRHAFDYRAVWDRAVYQDSGLRPKDFIWAHNNLRHGWGEIFTGEGRRSRNRMMIIYDSRLLENIKRHDVYSLKEGVNSFKDALLAVVFVYLRF